MKRSIRSMVIAILTISIMTAASILTFAAEAGAPPQMPQGEMNGGSGGGQGGPGGMPGGSSSEVIYDGAAEIDAAASE